VHAHSRELSGTLRVLASPVLATHLVAPAVAEFQRRYPEIVLDLHVEDLADPNVEDYDLAVVNDLLPIHSTAVVRTIHHAETVFCAAPAYLERYGEPKAPEDLKQHRCLRLRMPGVRLRPMSLIDPTQGDRRLEVEVPAVLMANHTDTLLRATVDGAGISSQAVDLVATLLRSGQLRRVLAPWITNRIALMAAMPSRKFLPARTRAFVDYLAEHARRNVAGLVQEEGLTPATASPASPPTPPR
jgi:DNA-binding transcriptional LysR family regulator